ncbi:MAG: DUF6134 family protein [Alphaproteobacteria bacterium]|nr:DUF6134 family protein [Alphaproteobacteria bacterium]
MPSAIDRRTILLGLTGLALSGGIGAARAGLTTPDADRTFAVFRNGDPIGHHKIDIRAEGERTVVDIDILLEVGIGPLILYRYTHRNREIWQNGAFQSFESETDDDGDTYRIRAERDGDVIRVSRSRGDDYETGDLSLLPTTYWNPETVNRPRMINTQDGEIVEVQIDAGDWQAVETAAGQVDARRFDVRGDMTLSLWYDRAGNWTKLSFPLKGDEFEYQLA